MDNYFEMLLQDIRIKDNLTACINCGVCTAICPAAEYYEYEPRTIVVTVQSGDNNKIKELLESDTIWYCGQCMSCKTRCPRQNCPGIIIEALRYLSQKTGLFVKSKKGRQQIYVKETIGENILNLGYCVHPSTVKPERHPEQGPVWEWIYENREEIFSYLGANYEKDGAGTLRKISPEVLDEIRSIFDVTGGLELFEEIEKYSRNAARELGYTEEEFEKYINDIIEE